MTLLDVIIVVGYMLAVTGFGLLFSKKGGSSTTDYLVADRKLPWWLAGTSMIAGSFNADSPLHQTRKTRETGISGLWFYWSEIIGLILGGLVFSRLWRRTELETPIAIYELRYGGVSGRFSRIYAALHVSFFESCIIGAIGLVGLRKVAEVIFQLPPEVTFLGIGFSTNLLVVLSAVTLAMIYSTASGLLGVVWTDLAEFLVALSCSWLLAFIILHEVGWGDSLRARLAEADLGDKLNGLPEGGASILVYFILRPFLASAGINQTNQRLLSVKDEREAVFSAVWRVLNHFVLRAWPWYICGLGSLILISEADLLSFGFVKENGEVDTELIYPLMIRQYLPVGLLGLMIAGFLSAFMSSIDTTIHTSSSIFLNDVYRRFIRPNENEAHYLVVVRSTMVLMTIISVVLALLVDNILALLGFTITVINSVAFIQIVRWFWWRINGWSELAAYWTGTSLAIMINLSPFGTRFLESLMAYFQWEGFDARFSLQFIFVTGVTALVSLTVACLTPPEDKETLHAFYRKVRPPGFWRPIREETGLDSKDARWGAVFFLWGLGVCFVFGWVASIGLLLLGHLLIGLSVVAFSLATGFLLVRGIRRWVQDLPLLSP